jgi:hypothetical protein
MRSRQRIGLLVAPWMFVCVFAGVWLGVLVPHASGGQTAWICVSFAAGLALVSFVVAAATFSRDVLMGRWP